MSDLQRDIAEIEAALEKVHIYQREDCKRLEAAWQRLRARLTPDQERVAALEGWKKAAIAWEVCASIHRKYAKGKDVLFSTRQQDFVVEAEKARAMLAAAARKGE